MRCVRLSDEIRARLEERGLADALERFPGEPDQLYAPREHLEDRQLSERELEVLDLVGYGLTNEAIAERLVISIETVKSHVKHIHARLGVGSRTGAYRRALELGLLAVEVRPARPPANRAGRLSEG